MTVYWDFNAAAPPRPEVVRARAERALAEGWANPSSVHAAGRAARARLDAARAALARALGCEPREVVLTASGSEADALAIAGAFRARKDVGARRIVASAVEHPAVLATLDRLARVDGAEVVRVPPGPDGRVDAEAFAAALAVPGTVLATLQWANNETGVVQPAAELSRACRQRGILFHTDAVQAVGKLPTTLREVDADLLALSAHKFGGPAGAGVLVVRRGVEVQALTPGHQEAGLRGGTQNVPYAEALALALELAHEEQPVHAARVEALRDTFEREVRGRLPDVTVNGEGAPRVPNTSNLCFHGADGEALLIALDLEGICVSSGAACASGTLTPSHVLLAMGLTPAQAHGSLRFSLGPGATEAEVARVVEALATHVPRARALNLE